METFFPDEIGSWQIFDGRRKKKTQPRYVPFSHGLVSPVMTKPSLKTYHINVPIHLQKLAILQPKNWLL